MAGIVFKVLPEFPSSITGVDPIFVTKSGLTYTIRYGSPTVAGALQAAQVKQALLTADPTGLVGYNIPPEPYNITNIAWHAPQAIANGALYNFIQTNLFAGNPVTMAAFWVTAATFPATP